MGRTVPEDLDLSRLDKDLLRLSKLLFPCAVAGSALSQ